MTADATCPSNQSIEVIDAGRVAFDAAMQLAFRRAPGGGAQFWTELPSIKHATRSDDPAAAPERWFHAHWRFADVPMLVLFWGFPGSLEDLAAPLKRFNGAEKAPQVERFMTTLDWKASADSAWNWLRLMPEKQLGPRPDLDGSCSRGFRVTSRLPWFLSPYAFAAISPEWAEYHK